MPDNITALIFESLDEVNLQLPPDRRVPKALETPLFGKDGWLDSLGMVNFIVVLEQKILNELKMSINITDDHFMAQQESPLRSVRMLEEYLRLRLARNK